MTKLRNQGDKQKALVEYLFLNLYTDGNDLSTLSTCLEDEIEERIDHFVTQAYTTESV